MSCSQVYWKHMKCPVKGFWVPVIQECRAVGRLLFALNADRTALACVVYPQFFPEPCESICLHFCLSFCPHDLWTSGPIVGTRSKSGALWDKLVLQMGKRDTVPWLMGGINQQLHLSRQLKLKTQICRKPNCPSWNAQNFIFKQTVCVYYGLLISARSLCSSWKEAWAKMYFRWCRSNPPFSRESDQGTSCIIILHLRRSGSFILWSSWELQEEKHGTM